MAEGRYVKVAVAVLALLGLMLNGLQLNTLVLGALGHYNPVAVETLVTHAVLRSSLSRQDDDQNPKKHSLLVYQEIGEGEAETVSDAAIPVEKVAPVTRTTQQEPPKAHPDESLKPSLALRGPLSACESGAAHQGIIVVSLLGRMGNNLFQVAVANRLAEQLCWSVVYRPSWQGPLAYDTRMRDCFPGAFTHATVEKYDQLPVDVQSALNVSAPHWEFLQKKQSSKQFDTLWNRVRESQPDGWWYDMDDKTASNVHQGHFLDNLVASIQNETLPTRVIHLRGFFIHSEYVEDWLPRIKVWSSVKSTCCQTKPSEGSETIILHWRDFSDADGKHLVNSNTDWVNVYTDILRHHGWYQQRPLWILTQPSSVDTPDVRRLVNLTNATVHTGVDVPDAMCLLQQATTVLMSYSSTFSQAPVLLGDSTGKEVHYPLIKLNKPAVTVPVSFWHYHLANKTGVERFDVSFENIKKG
mmetsp:Transcript_11401/g.21772  ORF Transcript_11401/g.21772 Transcript_11401/m.21772 type:complete len:469 (+) Transcript_11401:94-1500(+)|eukprot:scaffold37939_cov244-Amphora_coffeaeformis.AAC.5